MCVCGGGVLTNRGAHGGQKCWIPLKLEFQVIVSILIWVLETELGSPGNASGHSWPRNRLLFPPFFYFLFLCSLLSYPILFSSSFLSLTSSSFSFLSAGNRALCYLVGPDGPPGDWPVFWEPTYILGKSAGKGQQRKEGKEEGTLVQESC